jgi:hypothetical protein
MNSYASVADSCEHGNEDGFLPTNILGLKIFMSSLQLTWSERKIVNCLTLAEADEWRPTPTDGYLVTFRGMIRKHWERQVPVSISVFNGRDWERPQKYIVRTVSMETVKRINTLSQFGSSQVLKYDDSSCAGNSGAPQDAGNSTFSWQQRLIVRWFHHFQTQKRRPGNNIRHRRNNRVYLKLMW